MRFLESLVACGRGADGIIPHPCPLSNLAYERNESFVARFFDSVRSKTYSTSQVESFLALILSFIVPQNRSKGDLLSDDALKIRTVSNNETLLFSF